MQKKKKKKKKKKSEKNTRPQLGFHLPYLGREHSLVMNKMDKYATMVPHSFSVPDSSAENLN